MKFQQIRSATAIITYGGVRFLIDPWLSEKDAYPPIPGSPHPELRCPIHELPMPVEKIVGIRKKEATLMPLLKKYSSTRLMDNSPV